MIIHEARELYDAAKDAVSRVTLKVELHPGQVAEIKAFLSGVATKAGVYFAEIEHEVVQEARAAVAAVEAVFEAPAEPAIEPATDAPAPTTEPSQEDSAAQSEISGDSNGEQPLQQANPDDQGTDVGAGSASEAGNSDVIEPADQNGGVAGIAGQIGT